MTDRPDTLATRLATHAHGDRGEEAAVWLLTEHGRWLPVLERAGLIHASDDHGTVVIWSQAATQCLIRPNSGLIGTPSEWQVLAVACSLTGRHALGWGELASLDETNVRLVLHAVAWAARGRAWADALSDLDD
jgi:hypothetical protein